MANVLDCPRNSIPFCPLFRSIFVKKFEKFNCNIFSKNIHRKFSANFTHVRVNFPTLSENFVVRFLTNKAVAFPETFCECLLLIGAYVKLL